MNNIQRFRNRSIFCGSPTYRLLVSIAIFLAAKMFGVQPDRHCHGLPNSNPSGHRGRDQEHEVDPLKTVSTMSPLVGCATLRRLAVSTAVRRLTSFISFSVVSYNAMTTTVDHFPIRLPRITARRATTAGAPLKLRQHGQWVT